MRCVRICLQSSIESLNTPYSRRGGGYKQVRSEELYKPSEDELQGIWNGKKLTDKLKKYGLVRTVVGEEVQIQTKPKSEDEDKTYEPPLKRKWLPGPLSLLSTAHSRRDWFRLMCGNMLVDSWTRHPLDDAARALLDMRDPKLTHFRTTPVADVRPFVPKFAREGAQDSDPEFLPFDPELDGADVPPFLSPSFRALHIHNEVKYYKPDLLCLNEVQRDFAHTYLWKSLRPMGYGMFFSSSRGHSIHADMRGALLKARARRIPTSEDIGNVIFFHKGRFCPFYKDDMPQLHTVNLLSMRDKVTCMHVLLACVQLTAGAGDEAVAQRAHEAKQILQLIDVSWYNEPERYHTSTVICGDLNNVSDDEPCVEVFRNRFFSAYDIAGGPRWTAWYHQGSTEMNRYADKALSMREHEVYTSANLVRPSDLHLHTKAPIAGTRPTNIFKAEPPKINEKTLSRNTGAKDPPKALSREEILALEQAIPDKLMLRNEIQKRQGVAQRTQDFIFHNPEKLALVQLLDTPDEAQIDPQQLLPCRINPSHHIPLMADFSFNDQTPDARDQFTPRAMEAP